MSKHDELEKKVDDIRYETMRITNFVVLLMVMNACALGFVLIKLFYDF